MKKNLKSGLQVGFTIALALGTGACGRWGVDRPTPGGPPKAKATASGEDGARDDDDHDDAANAAAKPPVFSPERFFCTQTAGRDGLAPPPIALLFDGKGRVFARTEAAEDVHSGAAGLPTVYQKSYGALAQDDGDDSVSSRESLPKARSAPTQKANVMRGVMILIDTLDIATEVQTTRYLGKTLVEFTTRSLKCVALQNTQTEKLVGRYQCGDPKKPESATYYEFLEGGGATVATPVSVPAVTTPAPAVAATMTEEAAPQPELPVAAPLKYQHSVGVYFLANHLLQIRFSDQTRMARVSGQNLELLSNTAKPEKTTGAETPATDTPESASSEALSEACSVITPDIESPTDAIRWIWSF